MSKKEKLLQLIKKNPVNIRYDSIRKLLLNHGFTETVPRGGSSHYTYHKSQYRITIPKDNPVNKIYIKQVISIIEQLEDEE